MMVRTKRRPPLSICLVNMVRRWCVAALLSAPRMLYPQGTGAFEVCSSSFASHLFIVLLLLHANLFVVALPSQDHSIDRPLGRNMPVLTTWKRPEITLPAKHTYLISDENCCNHIATHRRPAFWIELYGSVRVQVMISKRDRSLPRPAASHPQRCSLGSQIHGFSRLWAVILSRSHGSP